MHILVGFTLGGIVACVLTASRLKRHIKPSRVLSHYVFIRAHFHENEKITVAEHYQFSHYGRLPRAVG